MRALNRFLRDRSESNAAEYCLIIAIVLIAIIAGIHSLVRIDAGRRTNGPRAGVGAFSASMPRELADHARGKSCRFVLGLLGKFKNPARN
jgi:hypothetical protein